MHAVVPACTPGVVQPPPGVVHARRAARMHAGRRAHALGALQTRLDTQLSVPDLDDISFDENSTLTVYA
jgi:hypothetical protein